MDITSQYQISSILEQLMTSLNKQISTIQLLKNGPIFIQQDCFAKIYLNFQACQSVPEVALDIGMRQEALSQVPHLAKDSLMPKGLNKQQAEQNDKVTQINESMQKKKKKNMNGTRTSFNRSNIHSVNNTHRNSKMSAVSRNKNKNDEIFISLVSDQVDPQIGSLRKIKNSQWDQMEKQKKLLQNRKKQFMEKKQIFKNQMSEKDYTYDFSGETLGSNINQQRINYYSMKMKLSMADKKMRTNFKFKQNELVKQIKLEPSKKLLLNGASVSFQVNTVIPSFPSQNLADPAAIFGLPSERQKCKLNQFKKYYGGKFSRLDRSFKTIDTTTEKNDQYQHIFSQRRYLKDEQKSINQSMISYRTRIQQVTKRKLAIPKIHGKYSTLDRYQNF